MIEAILWDNDGVLVDTEELFFAATRDVLARAGVELTRETYLEFALGNGRSMFDQFAAAGWTAQQIAELREQRDSAYATTLAAGCSLMSGVAETLAALKGRARMALVTTSLRKHFDLAHQRSDLLQFFEFVLAREDYTESKPHPEPYLTALSRLSLGPERCIVIEDSERGLSSARAAGLRCIIVPNRFTASGRFVGATAVLQDVRHLTELLLTL